MTRFGMGYDVHRLVEGRKLIIGGVEIPHTLGLLGHSDADVLLHAIADALLGAAALGDIGRHFPPSDPQWKGAESHIFLRHAAELARQMGFRISNADVTLICERPKIGPHRAAIQARVAEILALRQDRVSIKATTTEGLGFEGEGLGVTAHAVCLLAEGAESAQP